MKTKRQTIWLVSMLSLMVVLSAYYLFTEDSSPSATKSAEGQGQQVSVTDTQGTGDTGGAIVTEVTEDPAQADTEEDNATAAAGENTAGDTKAEGSDTASSDKPQTTASEGTAATSDEGKTAAADGDQQAADGGKSSQTAKTDEEVLQTAEAQGTIGSDQVDQYQYERVEANSKKAEELLQAMNDLTKSPEENAKAANEYNALLDKESKINDIEEQVSQRFGRAVVAEENDSFKVVVMNDKLKAKDAAAIIDLVISELEISQDQVKVQYVSSAK